ncbi:MAG TPA: hypothetical protein VF801_10020 [Rhodocyclaceae bacterium]
MPIPLIPALIGNAINNALDESMSAQPPAAAQQTVPVGLARTLPPNALRGQMNAAAVGSVQIDGKTLPLSPAGQIRNEANMIVMPTSITQTVPIRYLVDQLGYVTRIWILTPAELAASR